MSENSQLSERDASILFLRDAIADVRRELRSEVYSRHRQQLIVKLRGLEGELQQREAGPGAARRQPYTPGASTPLP